MNEKIFYSLVASEIKIIKIKWVNMFNNLSIEKYLCHLFRSKIESVLNC